jgi:ferredoxin
LVIVDGSVASERAVYGGHERLGLIVGGIDPFGVDIFCCRFLQVDYRTVGHLKMALQKGLVGEDFVYVNLANENEGVTSSLSTAEPDSLKQKLHRRIYQLVYFADIPYSKLFGGKSIIPKMHFYFGIRPYLDRSLCTDCGDCVPICPVNAIKIPQRTIDADLCMPVRCMRCIPACPENAIRAKGRDVHNYLG